MPTCCTTPLAGIASEADDPYGETNGCVATIRGCCECVTVRTGCPGYPGTTCPVTAWRPGTISSRYPLLFIREGSTGRFTVVTTGGSEEMTSSAITLDTS